MPATAAAPFPVAAGTRLLGGVIARTCAGVSVTHPALLAALRDAGPDESVARELAPEHAFTRACKTLSDARITRRVAKDEAAVRYEYARETVLTRDKKTGTATCGPPGLATLAREAPDRAIDARSGGDVTRVIQEVLTGPPTCSRSAPGAGATSPRPGTPPSWTRCRPCSGG